MNMFILKNIIFWNTQDKLHRNDMQRIKLKSKGIKTQITPDFFFFENKRGLINSWSAE